MSHQLTGFKIRAERKRAGLTQADLARRAGISASYLNLIERNKRPIAGALLDRVANGLSLDRSELDGEEERRVVANLNEIATDPAVTDGLDRPEPAEQLVGYSPGWAALLLGLYRAFLDRGSAVLALADRLNRDPFLGESIHRVLTNVTSIRAASEILQQGELTERERRRFLEIIASDSSQLSTTAQSLAGFFDSAHTRVRSATPMEHVDAFMFQMDNYFPELEAAAADFLRTMRPGETPDAAAERMLGAEHDAVLASLQTIPEAAETRRFRMMKRIATLIAASAITDIVTAHHTLASDEARALADAALHSYTAAAILMPYEQFFEAAERHRYDVDALARLFGVSYEQAAHRLATLRRPRAEGVRFAFMRSDPSGYVTKRLPLPELPLPRYGNACPMWVIYGAFQTPGATVRSLGELPSGEKFLFFARAVEKQVQSVAMPRLLLSIMLACQASDAERVVYADGFDRTDRAAFAPVGTTCRLCHREGCGHRQEAALIA